MNIFAYKIDSYTTYIIDARGRQSWQVVYYNYFYRQTTGAAVLASLVVIIINYVTLVLLVLFNMLIFLELRRVIDAKKRLIIATPNTDTMPTISYQNPNTLETLTDQQGPQSKHQQTHQQQRQHRPSLIMHRSQRGNSIAPAELMIIASPEDKGREFLTRVLIMTLWTSLMVSIDRFVKVAYRSFIYWNSASSVYAYYLGAISYVCDMLVYSSFLFIYIRTNKLFRRKFSQIFSTRSLRACFRF